MCDACATARNTHSRRRRLCSSAKRVRSVVTSKSACCVSGCIRLGDVPARTGMDGGQMWQERVGDGPGHVP